MATDLINNNKNMKRLSDRETVHFVELYESEEVLWNVRHANYKKKDARDSAVARIVQKLGIPGFNAEHVLKKINNIRSTYIQEVNKIKSSTITGCSPETIYVPKVSWFDIAHSFLPGVMKTRTTFTNLNLNADQEVIESQEENTEVGRNPADANSEEPQLASDSNTTSFNVKDNSKALNNISPTIPDAHSGTERQLPQNKSGKKRRLDSSKVPDHITKAVKTLQSIKDDVSQMENQDEFSHFTKNVACQLRELPIIAALQCQSEILNLIQKKRIENLQRQQYVSVLSPNRSTAYISARSPTSIYDDNTEFFIISSDGDSTHPPENSVDVVSSHRPGLNILEEAVKHSGVFKVDK